MSIATYQSYPVEFRKQLRSLVPFYRSSSRLRRYLTDTPDPDRHLAGVIARHVAFRNVAKKHLKHLWCYHPDGQPRVLLQSILVEGSHVLLFNAVVEGTGEKVIVKWYENTHRRMDTSYENNIYNRLGQPEPCWSTEYYLWNMPVLIMTPLIKLTRRDDPYQVGISVIHQLRPLHQFGVHNDIKPGNVMRKKNGDYVVIDYGGCTLEKLEHGYKRWIWSPDYTSQLRKSQNDGIDIVTTAKNDLLEIGFTMQCLKTGMNSKQCRSGFKGRIREYMERVEKWDDRRPVTDTLRSELIQILSKGGSHE